MGKIVINKPEGGFIINDKPSQNTISVNLSNRMITRSVDALTPIGLLLVWTYRDTETFTTEYNP
jgi:hypothetical protein